MNQRWLLGGLYSLAVVILFYMLFMSVHDSLYFYSDDFAKVTQGRRHPLPEMDSWIAGRVVDDYLMPFMFIFFAEFIAPLLGLTHIADIHSVYATGLSAFINLTSVIMLLLYIRLAVEVPPRYVILIGLGAVGFFVVNVQLYHFTRLHAYHFPFLLSIVLLYPFVAVFVNDADVFKGLRSSTATTGMAILSYFVAFSVTNVEFFTSVTLLWIAVHEVITARKNLPASQSSIYIAIKDVLRRRPMWFKLNIVLLPLLSCVAAFLDLKSPRFVWEKELAADRDGLEWYQLILRSLEDIFTSRFDLGMGVLPLAMLSVAVAFNWRRDGAARLFKLSGLFLMVTILYVVFVSVLSDFSGKDYLNRSSFGAYLFFSLTLVLFLFAVSLRSHPAGRVLAIVFLILCAFNGMLLLMVNEIRPAPLTTGWSYSQYKPVSKSDMRNIFDTLYMNHCYGNEDVIVYLPQSAGNELGHPYIPDVSDPNGEWFRTSYLRVIEAYIVEPGTLGDYNPTYRITNDPVVFRGSIHDLATDHVNRCMAIESSPYFIKLEE
jgi:hypothetical protein